MNGRERFKAVLSGKLPDMVPVTSFILDQGHFISQLYPDIDPHDFQSLQLKVIEVQKQFGMDVFVRLLFGVNDPLFLHMGGLNITTQTENWEVKTEIFYKEQTRIEKSIITTPGGVLRQEFAYNEVRPGTFLYACTHKPIRNIEDLELAEKYEPHMLPEWKGQVKKRIEIIRDAVGEDGIIGVWSPHGPFNNASILFPHEELYMLFLTDPVLYDRLMQFSMNRILDYTEAIDEAGVDVHCIGGNVPGGFLGKNTYDRYILPYEKEYIGFVQKNGTPAMYHNCGEIMNLVDSYKELGVKIVEPFSPSPLGDCDDLAAAKKQVNGSYIMLSGIDQVNVLQNGSPDDVRYATEKRMLEGKNGGNFIMQPVDFLEYGTPEENLYAYVETAREYSVY